MNEIVDRQSLEAAITETLDRQDIVSNVPAWIRLFEAAVNRVLENETRHACVVAPFDRDRMQLPDDWMETVSARITSEGDLPPLAFMERNALLAYSAAAPPDVPCYYTHLGRFMVFGPAPARVMQFKLDYFRRVRLSEELDATNWLLESHPDLYLYGTLAHSAPFLKNDERLTMWSGITVGILVQINDNSEKAKMSGSRLNRGSSLRT